jgi:Zn-dependent peptidase ImmA (M78 family)
MLGDLDAGDEIARLTDTLLRKADAEGRLPTPVEDIIAAAKLTEAEEALFSESILAGLPKHLAAAMRRVSGKVSAALDRKERVIYISSDVAHDGQRRFKQLHEVTHELLPWQADTAYADNHLSLSWHTRVQFEQEANQGGAELLFQRTRFQAMAADYAVGFGGVLELADEFGASYHASFRRYVETHRAPIAGVVLECSPCEPGELVYRRKEAMNSKAWSARYEPASTFPKKLVSPPYDFVNDIQKLGGDSPLRSTWGYPNLSNETTMLDIEMWSNSYKVFVLAWVPQRERFKRHRLILPSVSTQPLG